MCSHRSSISAAARYWFDCGRAAGDGDRAGARGRARLGEGRFDAASDEGEGRAALHSQWVTRLVAEHDHRRVVGRVLAPPAAPGFVPGAAAGAEYVAAHDVRPG
jgi:hypothetical protein